MSAVLGIDTATAATTVALLDPGGEAFERRHDPGPGERPGHATRLLGLVEEVLAAGSVTLEQVERVAVGTGPGSFTGLRIGVATARGLAQAVGAGLVGVSTLRALASGVPAEPDRPVVAVVDARRGEAFAAAWRGNTEVMAPAALAPADLAREVGRLQPAPLAVGDGAIRFRTSLEPAGASVPPGEDRVHRVSALHTCRLGVEGQPGPPDGVLPDYLRLPDAEANRR